MIDQTPPAAPNGGIPPDVAAEALEAERRLAERQANVVRDSLERDATLTSQIPTEGAARRARPRLKAGTPIRANRFALAAAERDQRIALFNAHREKGLVPQTARLTVGLLPLLDRLQVTQEALATRARIDVNTVSRAVMCHAPPTKRTVRALAKALGVNQEELFKENPRPPSTRSQRRAQTLERNTP